MDERAMNQDENGVPIPWDRDFEEAARQHPELQSAIDRWYEEVDGPGSPDLYQVWAEVSCQVMREMAIMIAHPETIFNPEPGTYSDGLIEDGRPEVKADDS